MQVIVFHTAFCAHKGNSPYLYKEQSSFTTTKTIADPFFSIFFLWQQQTIIPKTVDLQTFQGYGYHHRPPTFILRLTIDIIIMKTNNNKSRKRTLTKTKITKVPVPNMMMHCRSLIFCATYNSSIDKAKDAFIMQLDTASTSMQRQPICVSDGSGLHRCHSFCGSSSDLSSGAQFLLDR